MRKTTLENLTKNQDIVVCNNLLYNFDEVVNGEDFFNGDNEIMQTYIISKDFADYLCRHTDLMIIHNECLDIFGLCLEWYGISWSQIEVIYYV